MSTIEPLSPSYTAARAAFIEGAESAGARLRSWVHPERGPEGEELAVDVAELGAADAPDVVMVVSATHGVEGYCGSALQREWLSRHATERPDHVRVVFVHAFNPYGFAWVRRVNEDNVDLNRNFVDWSAPDGPPANLEYAEIADLVVPAEWSDAEQERTTGELMARAMEVGLDRFQAIISGGQYHHPTGIFYGGTGPTWSHRWLREFAAEHLVAAERLTIIDLHTGLGPWGHGELISHAAPGDAQYDRAAVRWDGVRSFLAGDSVSAELTGDWLGIAQELAPGSEVTPVAIEYGTVDIIEVLQALRADAWLHAHGDPTGPDAPAVRAQVRAAFADDDPSWIATCWPRFHEVLSASLAG
jgi:hypothetical protein